MPKKMLSKKGFPHLSKVKKARDLADLIECSLAFFPEGKKEIGPKVRVVAPKPVVESKPAERDPLMPPMFMTRQYGESDPRHEAVVERDGLLSQFVDEVMANGILEQAQLRGLMDYLTKAISVGTYCENDRILALEPRLYKNWLQVTLKDVLEKDHIHYTNSAGKEVKVVNPVGSFDVRADIAALECLEVAPKLTLADMMPGF